MSQKFQTTLNTALTLITQFQTTLSAQPAPASQPPQHNEPLDPLALLAAAATALKSHVTKLSLLTITAPFTHSAVATILATLNETVLPSLVAAALLLTPETHTRAYQ
ncbi:hypothetical protein ARAM_004076, partial [Aspergillus rambellii]